MYGWSQIFVRFALRGLVSEKNEKKYFYFFSKKKLKFSFFGHFTCMGYLKFSSVSLYEASFPRKRKRKKIPQKSKIFIFLTFYMYGLAQIFVRFALRGLVSEKRKKVKFSFFGHFYMYGWSQIFVRFALRGLVSEKNEQKNYLFFSKKSDISFFWHFTCIGDLKFSSVSLYEA